MTSNASFAISVDRIGMKRICATDDMRVNSITR
jgi:hypothetical protein